MGIASVQLIIPKVSGVPADSVVNTFHFDTFGDDVTPADADAITEQLHDFWTNAIGLSQALCLYLSPFMATSGWTVKVFDQNAAPPKVPVAITTFDVTATGVAALPSEVALCMSFKAAPVSGVPAGRRRGRIYLGELSTNSVHSDLGDVRPVDAFMADVVAAGSRLFHTAELGDDPRWKGWSTTDGVTWTIATIWCDNALDTQRRRGTSATTRVSLGVV